jgi:Flp pilus assembly pilin Flp
LLGILVSYLDEVRKNSYKGERGKMNLLTNLFVKAREWRKGQTMTEYALILAAVAVVVFVTYQVMGQDINSLVNSIDKSLTST